MRTRRNQKTGSELPELIVVIPTHNEPSLDETLLSLLHSNRAVAFQIQIIVVVNDSNSSPAGVRKMNAETLQYLKLKKAQFAADGINLTPIDSTGLSAVASGVGLARKSGMDLAASILSEGGRADRPIVSLDADCTVSPNYIREIERFFRENDADAVSIHFEHPLTLAIGKDATRAIVEYELVMRYFVDGLRRAGYPAAFHTVGSAMAVRASIYLAEGGMNTRQGAEDFYFLQKIIARGNFFELNQATVFPSPRPSTRAPFGTGQAVSKRLSGSDCPKVHPLVALNDIETLFNSLNHCTRKTDCAEITSLCSPAMKTYLQQQKFTTVWQSALDNTSTDRTFKKRVYAWFNLFRARKYFASEGFDLTRLPVVDAAKQLYGDIIHSAGTPYVNDDDVSLLLEIRKAHWAGKRYAYVI